MAVRRVVAELRRDGTVGAQPALGVAAEQVPVEPGTAGQAEAGLHALTQRRGQVAIARSVVVGVVLYQSPANARWLAACKLYMYVLYLYV